MRIVKVWQTWEQAPESLEELDFGGKHIVFDFSGGK
jgi:hypothetical protein